MGAKLQYGIPAVAVSWSLERSVFGYFVTAGLSGAADLNKDHAIDLDELHRYVTVNTAAWVRDATAGAEAQTPVLLWGGGRDFKPRDCPVLLPNAASVASARLQFPARTGAFKMPPGTVGSPYVQQAQGEYAPELNRASKDATRKVPGSKTAKTTMRTAQEGQETDPTRRSKNRGSRQRHEQREGSLGKRSHSGNK